MATHYHWSTPWQDGMGDIDNGTHEDFADVLDALADWLEQAEDAAQQSAEALADAEEYEDAWLTLKRADAIGVDAINLRTVAQQYADAPADPAGAHGLGFGIVTVRDKLTERAHEILAGVDAGQDTPYVIECGGDYCERE